MRAIGTDGIVAIVAEALDRLAWGISYQLAVAVRMSGRWLLVVIPHAAMRATFGLRQPELPLFKSLGFRREF